MARQSAREHASLALNWAVGRDRPTSRRRVEILPLFITILSAAFVVLLASLWRVQGGHAAEELSIPALSERRARRVRVLLVARWTGVFTYVRAMAKTGRHVRLSEDLHRQLTTPAATDAPTQGCESRSRNRYRRGIQRRPPTRARLPTLCPPVRARACRRFHPARLAVLVARIGGQHREPFQLAALIWRVEVGPNRRRVHLVYGSRFRRIGQGTRKSLSWRTSAPTTERGSS